MCDSKGLMYWFYPPSLLSLGKDKKSNQQTNATVNTLNQQASNQVEANKVANSVQSTEQTTPANQIKKLNTQKLPLNTSATGATVGSNSAVGLNLGGY